MANVRVNSGKDGKRYVYGVADLHRYLQTIYGPPDVDKKAFENGGVTPDDFAGEQGIIEFENFHMDLWDGWTCIHACYFNAVKRVFLWRAPPGVAPQIKALYIFGTGGGVRQ